MIIIPFATDAPVYHFPKATIGVIVVNVAIHAAWCASGPEAAEPYAMKLGSGLHPLQWLTHNFLHADILHLLFNMIFLWAYGIIVEGKIGPLPFLLNYLAIGTLHGAIIQAAYLHAGHPSYVLGASAIIFGLMAMSMLWAPVNEISCFFVFIIGFRILSNTFECPIYAFALLEFAWEGTSMGWQYLIRGDPLSSGLLHISGALWGMVAGVLILQAGWVDCEGWDVFSLLKKRRDLRQAWDERGEQIRRRQANERLPKSLRSDDDRAGLSPEERSARRLTRLRRAIESDDMDQVQVAYKKWADSLGEPPPRDTLLSLIKLLHGREQYLSSVPLMRALCRFHPKGCEKVRLKLAGLLLRDLQRPTEAQRLLEQVIPDRLDPAGRLVRQKLLADAAQQISEGVLEVEEEL